MYFPPDCGGLGLPMHFQQQVDAELAAAGAPPVDTGRNGIGLGMAAPTIVALGTAEQNWNLGLQQRYAQRRHRGQHPLLNDRTDIVDGGVEVA